MEKKLNRDEFFTDVATRSFRDQADRDYILARVAYKKQFYCQYHWNGLQAIEKYIKAILLFNKISSVSMKHNLLKGLELLGNIPFIKLSDLTKDMIQHFATFGLNRYLTYSYCEFKYSLGNFDFSIWDIRKYCRLLSKENTSQSDDLIQQELLQISNASVKNVKSVYIKGGLIEDILKNKDDPAREDLIWQNGFFVLKNRKKVKQKNIFNTVNSPLSMHPEFLEELTKYVYLSGKELNSFRDELKRRNK